MAIDLNVRVPSEVDISHFLSMAKKLGFVGIAAMGTKAPYLNGTEGETVLVNRAEILETSLKAVKRSAMRLRMKSTIVALPLRGIEVANWAAEDSRIDLLTLTEPLNEYKLRPTTAKLAAASHTALEVPVLPLLHTTGLVRARLLKSLRENTKIAVNAGMHIVLSSGCSVPIHMRSPMALSHIGLLLGLDIKEAKRAAFEYPHTIVSSNLKRFQSEYLGPGMELVREEDNK
ncbi:MAG: hypothetical protein EAX81_02315 [Candidatus Thorarchaeota archaeon]|nr:hypothetical protein [Candidatus Thorarchaeota archaeon]